LLNHMSTTKPNASLVISRGGIDPNPEVRFFCD
jgi:hypothetical protein